MDPQQSSATAAVDPDRISIQYFEKGGANPQRDPVVIVSFSFDINEMGFWLTYFRFPLRMMKVESVSLLVLKMKIIPLETFYVTL